MSDDACSVGQVQVIGATSKALQVQLESEDEPRWIPRSVIHDDSEVYDDDKNAAGTLVLKRWFAEKEGLA